MRFFCKSVDQSREEERSICVIENGGVERAEFFGKQKGEDEWQEI
jgi:hypothetical protein